jgi:hypothetical protein
LHRSGRRHHANSPGQQVMGGRMRGRRSEACR